MFEREWTDVIPLSFLYARKKMTGEYWGGIIGKNGVKTWKLWRQKNNEN